MKQLKNEMIFFLLNSNVKLLTFQITLMYAPGKFPYIDDNGSYVNGGIPQRADLNLHINAFKQRVKDYIPTNFEGYNLIILK